MVFPFFKLPKELRTLIIEAYVDEHVCTKFEFGALEPLDKALAKALKLIPRIDIGPEGKLSFPRKRGWPKTSSTPLTLRQACREINKEICELYFPRVTVTVPSISTLLDLNNPHYLPFFTKLRRLCIMWPVDVSAAVDYVYARKLADIDEDVGQFSYRLEPRRAFRACAGLTLDELVIVLSVAPDSLASAVPPDTTLMEVIVTRDFLPLLHSRHTWKRVVLLLPMGLSIRILEGLGPILNPLTAIKQASWHVQRRSVADAGQHRGTSLLDPNSFKPILKKHLKEQDLTHRQQVFWTVDLLKDATIAYYQQTYGLRGSPKMIMTIERDINLEPRTLETARRSLCESLKRSVGLDDGVETWKDLRAVDDVKIRGDDGDVIIHF